MVVKFRLSYTARVRSTECPARETASALWISFYFAQQSEAPEMKVS